MKGHRPWHWGRGQNDGHQDAHERGAHHTGRQAPPQTQGQSTPRDTRRRKPAKMRRHSPDQTPHEPHRVAPTGHRAPHRERRGHPHGEKGLHPQREPLGTRHSPPTHPNRQATTPAAARATRKTQRHGHQRENGTRPRHPGRRATRTQRDRTGGDPTHRRGPCHPTPQTPARP